MTTLNYRHGSTQDPSYAHDDGTHTVFVTDILQRGTASQVYRALTDPDRLAAWTGTPATAGPEGTVWRIADLGLTATSVEDVVGERLTLELEMDGWDTARSRAGIRLWAVPRATMVVVTHRGLSEDDISRARLL
ncbi:MAG: SRPBCC domain-containing protein, partial [Streptosporangiaceae bacterium]